MTFDIEMARRQFPALSLKDNGKDRVYFDNPAGTQVPQMVIDRMVQVLTASNANLGGYFKTTQDATAIVENAHQVMADFYNAKSAGEIAFGQNMTSLTLHFSRCLAKRFKAGDEIILSRMDHDANVAPWLLMAADVGMVVKWLDFDTDSCEFPEDALTKVLTDRTKILAMGMASNCTGTVHDVIAFTKQAKEVGALVYLDAVQYAPHYAMDVQAIGADVVVSSAYKWFGPHQGILWARESLMREMFTYKVRPVSDDELGHKFEPGTQSHEGMAGCVGAVEYLAQFGAGASRREKIVSAWQAMAAYEQKITLHLIEGLKAFKGLQIHGVTSANAMHRRVPTVSFTIPGVDPANIAKHMGRENIFVWSGHNYALEPIAKLGLTDKGGVVRVGLAHYNTVAEVDAMFASLHRALK